MPKANFDFLFPEIAEYISQVYEEENLDSKFLSCPIENPVLSESFSDMLMRLIKESGMTPPQCYSKAGITKQHFSKINSDSLYQPKKDTVVAFALTLGLGLDKSKDLLESAGFALSHASIRDIIIEYFILNRIKSIDDLNAALDAKGYNILGEKARAPKKSRH